MLQCRTCWLIDLCIWRPIRHQNTARQFIIIRNRWKVITAGQLRYLWHNVLNVNRWHTTFGIAVLWRTIVLQYGKSCARLNLPDALASLLYRWIRGIRVIVGQKMSKGQVLFQQRLTYLFLFFPVCWVWPPLSLKSTEAHAAHQLINSANLHGANSGLFIQKLPDCLASYAVQMLWLFLSCFVCSPDVLLIMCSAWVLVTCLLVWATEPQCTLLLILPLGLLYSLALHCSNFCDNKQP